MTFDVRWPDGRTQRCWSPSLVVHDHLRDGSDYTVADFVDRSSRALKEGSDRVEAAHGVACTAAAATRRAIVAAAGAYPPAATVRVVAMRPHREATT